MLNEGKEKNTRYRETGFLFLNLKVASYFKIPSKQSSSTLLSSLL